MEFNRNKRFGSGGGSRDGGGGGGKKFYGKPSGRPSFGGGRGGFGGGRDGGRPSMHPAVCDECGNECEVPFRPSGDKPVFCNNCFKREGDSDRSGGRNFDKPSYGRDNRDSGRPSFHKESGYGDRDRDSRDSRDGGNKGADLYTVQFEMLNAKLDKLIRLLAPPDIIVNKKEQASVEAKAEKAAAEPVKKAKVKKAAKKVSKE